MLISKNIIDEKIKEILKEIDFRGNISSISNTKDENKFGLYEQIYSGLKGLEKELCVCFHSELNGLFKFMNDKSKTNRNFNANESRELIKIIQSIKDAEKLFSKISKVFKVSDYYNQQIDYTSTFLARSNGSEIPEDYQQIEITDIEPVFFIKDNNSIIQLDNKHKITRDFALEQLNKIELKLEAGDFDGVITNVRSLVEDVLIEIYKEVSGLAINRNGEINQYWNQLKKELNLDQKNQLNDSLKQIITGLSSILNGLSSLRNIAGDGHSREFKPSGRHAKLAVNSSLTFIEFIYDVLEYQKSRVDMLKNEFEKLNFNLYYKDEKDPWKENHEPKTNSEILELPEIKEFLKKCDNFLKRKLLKHAIDTTNISSFADCNTFIMKLIILENVLEKEQIKEIEKKFESNNQAIGLQIFLKEFSI